MWVRTLRLLGTRSPQPLQSWLVYWAGTATTRRPAHAALASRMAPKLRPARVTDALGQVVVPYHVGDLQVFEIDRVVLAAAAAAPSCGESRRVAA